MRVGYFVNIYPKVSHSFIRREILALEARGLQVDRYALRLAAEDLVDDDDRREVNATRYVLKAGIAETGACVLDRLRAGPRRFFSTFIRAVKLGYRSDRGLALHIAYFIEACVLARWLITTGTDHVHAHFGTNSAAVVYLAEQLGGPGYSFTVHGPEEFDKPEFIGLRTKVLHSRFAVAISSFGRSQLYRWLPLQAWSRVRIVRCGLGPDFLDADSVPMTRAPRLVCVGRLCEQKGQLLLVQAVAVLAQEGRDVELVLAGDGPLRPELERLVQRHGISANVRITGWLSGAAVRTELEQARALVLPSFAEGLPVVIMEALAVGRPVVSTYVAGIPELISDGVNGWLLPAGDLDGLVHVLREVLMAAPETLQAMGLAGRRHVAAYHDVRKESTYLAALFDAAVAGKALPVNIHV